MNRFGTIPLIDALDAWARKKNSGTLVIAEARRDRRRKEVRADEEAKANTEGVGFLHPLAVKIASTPRRAT